MSRTFCPDCQASRGLAQYENSTYCFSCSTYNRIKSLIISESKEENVYFHVESVITSLLPIKAEEWLKKYCITNRLIEKFNIGWEQCLQRIHVPYIVDKQELFSWNRSINQDVKNKWLFQGDKNIPFWLQSDHDSSKLVIVEDVLSAIRVSDYCDVLALGGTNFNKEMFLNVFKQYKTLVTFFDGDEAGKSCTQRFNKRFKLLYNIKNIQTKQDPKNYDPKALEDVLK